MGEGYMAHDRSWSDEDQAFLLNACYFGAKNSSVALDEGQQAKAGQMIDLFTADTDDDTFVDPRVIAHEEMLRARTLKTGIGSEYAA